MTNVFTVDESRCNV
jgi:hypothetical protein